MNNISNFT